MSVMSTAFDTVQRNKLFKILQKILGEDELHMMKTPIENVNLKVRIENILGASIKTNIGVPQVDCLSPVLFVLYLAEALKETCNIMKPSHEEDHRYAQDTNFILRQQYADDVSWVTNTEKRKEDLKTEL